MKFSKNPLQNSNLDLSGSTPELCRLCLAVSAKLNLRSAPSLTTCRGQLTLKTNVFTCSQRWMGRHSLHLEDIRQVPAMSLAAPSQLPEPLDGALYMREFGWESRTRAGSRHSSFERRNVQIPRLGSGSLSVSLSVLCSNHDNVMCWDHTGRARAFRNSVAKKKNRAGR